ncbi:hypothetical protein [Chitinophaga sp. YIM B06452]|uniref:hypothetical protein n=1 Tax=Chitinophaga sp. YIM B06452 TaxID=3082158 RepID=UPI0031FEF12E
MHFKEAEQLVKEFNIAEDGTRTFMAAAIILHGIETGEWNPVKISKKSGYHDITVRAMIRNLKKYEFLVDGQICMESEPDSPDFAPEFILMAMAVAGKLKVQKVTITNPLPPSIEDNVRNLPAIIYDIPWLPEQSSFIRK